MEPALKVFNTMDSMDRVRSLLLQGLHKSYDWILAFE